jgi:hypothetical protein
MAALVENNKKSKDRALHLSHERVGVERLLLQKEGNKRLVYQIHYPSSSIAFAGKDSPILERVKHFEVHYKEDEAEHFLRGEKAIYDFKKQTLFADHFHLSIYKKEEPFFNGLGSQLTFNFYELGPYFSSKNFTAHLNLEDR